MDAFIWLAAMVVFLIIESNTVALVSVWFAAGALVALLVSFLGAELWLQITVFLVVSALLLACLRPFFRKHIKPGITRTNVDSLVGSKGYVTADIDNVAAQGQVKLNGMEWSARSVTGKPIPAGTLVMVDHIEGVKAFVSPVSEEMRV